LPRLRLCEGKVVWRDADDGAVLFVNGKDIVREATDGLGVGSGGAEGSPEEWTWVVL